MATAFAPYSPCAEVPWDRRRVVHLHRRAAFGASRAEVERDLAEGPDAAIGRLLCGAARRDIAAGFEETSALLRATALQMGDVARLQAWWLHRIVQGPDPLGEKLTLLWHDHFATGVQKVRRVDWMAQQNDSLRRHARGPFGALLDAMVRDPALLAWLDAPANVKGRPNENLARELLELFTLGIGPFSEEDVREAARALTGWTIRGGRAVEEEEQHDDGAKQLLGRSGAFHALDLPPLLLDHPATARRLAWRLETLLFGEGVVGAAAHEELAERLRATALDVGAAVALLLRSRLFFDEANLASRVAGPVEWVATIARALELDAAGISSRQLADAAGRMGQELFLPPNVGGWKGGRAWLDTQSYLQRAQFAAAIARGALLPEPRDWAAWSDGAASDAPDRQDAVAVAARQLTGDDAVLEEVGGERGEGIETRLARLLAAPTLQLG